MGLGCLKWQGPVAACPLVSVQVAGLCRCLCCCRLPVGPLSVLYSDMHRCSRRRQTGKHTDDSREQRTGNKRCVRLDARQSRASCACGGWWLVAGGWRPHMGVWCWLHASRPFSATTGSETSPFGDQNSHTTRHLIERHEGRSEVK